MSRCDLDLWPWTFIALRCYAFKLCTKFERNWVIHGRVIDDLARFRRAILGVGHFCPTFLRGAWTQLDQTWREYRAIKTTQEICFRVLISCYIFNCGRLKVEWCFKRRQISHFLRLVKLGKGRARSLYQLLKLYLRPNLRNTFDGYQLRGC